MKCFALDYMILVYKMSLPVRGAWVEIVPNFGSLWSTMSLPVRGAWVEIIIPCGVEQVELSLPVRGAWVEMLMPPAKEAESEVAPRAGSVG